MFAHCFKDRDDVHRLALFLVLRHEARQDRAAINKDGGAVEPRNRDHGTGHVFITAADRDQTVKTLGGAGGFNGIRNDVAGDEAIAHAFGSHADAVRDGNGVKADGASPGGIDAIGGMFPEFPEVDIAGGHVAGGTRNCDLRFFKIGIIKANCAQHGAGGSAVWAVNDDRGMGADVLIRHIKQ